MNVLDKIQVHITDIVKTRSPSFTLYRILHIIDRRIGLPDTLFLNDFGMSPKEEHLIPYMIPKNSATAIDIGANTGMWTKYLSDKGFSVIAFEPNPRTSTILQRKFGKKQHVLILNYALADRNGVGRLHLHHSSPHDSLELKAKDYTGTSILVSIRRLDDFQFQHIGLIKIDTEGYEVPILLGSQDTIKRCRPRLIIEVHGPVEAEQEKICTLLRKLDYRWIIRLKPFSHQPHIIADYNYSIKQ